jgi:predicted ATPase/DNA-binding CsgD family transcriptional regulator
MSAALPPDRSENEPIALSPSIWRERAATEPPLSLTPMIGREREMVAVSTMLRQPEVRLVTLTGPGGVGKTRIACQIAVDLQPHFADGVIYASLISIRDPDLVASAMAQPLGVQETGDRPLVEALRGHLRTRHLLLVLDNFEHVLAATPLIAGLLATCPLLTILVTSRARLRIYGERIFLVPPMTLPDPERLPPLPQLSRYEAVSLFVERAQAVRADFQLTASNASTVVAICCRLDGVPLAIELAAAHIAIFPPLALLARLEHSLPLLTGGPQDQPARHQTMRDAIAWSHNLLGAEEQVIFRRLAVFAGGFTLEAAEAVAGDWTLGPGDQKADKYVEAAAARSRPPVTSVLDVVTLLVDKSLLRPSDQATHEPRFEMLETIREYGLERLEASGEATEVQRRHAVFFLNLGESLAARMSGAEMALALEQLSTELANVRVTLTWVLNHNEAETAQRVTSALYSYWNFRGRLSEGRRWLDAALTMSSEGTTTRVDALLAAAGLAALQGDHSRAANLVNEGLTISRARRYSFGIARGLFLLGVMAGWQGDLERAWSFYEEALGRREDFAAMHWSARLLTTLADTAQLRDDIDQAEALAEAGLSLARQAGHAWTTALALGVLAGVALERGERAQAVRLHTESLILSLEIGDQRGVAGTLAGLAGVAESLGQLHRAAFLLGAARARGDSIGVVYLGRHEYYERVLAATRARMDEKTFAVAWDKGRAAPPDEVVTTALAEASAAVGTALDTIDEAMDVASLTRREMEVLRLVVAGRSDREIAGALFISHRTVNAHVAHIFDKLGVNSRAEVAARAVRIGLV